MRYTKIENVCVCVCVCALHYRKEGIGSLMLSTPHREEEVG